MSITSDLIARRSGALTPTAMTLAVNRPALFSIPFSSSADTTFTLEDSLLLGSTGSIVVAKFAGAGVTSWTLSPLVESVLLVEDMRILAAVGTIEDLGIPTHEVRKCVPDASLA